MCQGSEVGIKARSAVNASTVLQWSQSKHGGACLLRRCNSVALGANAVWSCTLMRAIKGRTHATNRPPQPPPLARTAALNCSGLPAAAHAIAGREGDHILFGSKERANARGGVRCPCGALVLHLSGMAGQMGGAGDCPIDPPTGQSTTISVCTRRLIPRL